MFAPLKIVSKALWAVRAFVSLHLLVHDSDMLVFSIRGTEYLVAALARVCAGFVRDFVSAQALRTNESRTALVTYKVLKVLVHVLIQSLVFHVMSVAKETLEIALD